MSPLIPRGQIAPYDGLTRSLIEGSEFDIDAFVNDPDSGEALRYSLLFSDASVLQQTALAGLTNLELFYNQYYWFLLFTKLHQIRHGSDVGLEQQAFKLLENAPDNIDWYFVEAIVKRVASET